MRNKRVKKSHSANHERWLVSYADFITLLFAFFTILYATSQKDLGKSQEFQKSIQKYLIKFGALGGSGSEIKTGQKFDSPIEMPIKRQQRDGNKNSNLIEQIETYAESALSEEELNKVVADISTESIGVRISLSGSQIFAKDSAKFNQTALPILNKMATLIKENKLRLFVEGHMGKSPMGTSVFKNNWELASHRAINLIRYFEKVHNIESGRMAAISYGDERPIYPNDTIENQRKNERIELLFMTADFL